VEGVFPSRGPEGGRASRNTLRIANHLSLLCEVRKGQNPRRVNYWEIIADDLSKAGWNWSCLSAVDRDGRTIFQEWLHQKNVGVMFWISSTTS